MKGKNNFLFTLKINTSDVIEKYGIKISKVSFRDSGNMDTTQIYNIDKKNSINISELGGDVCRLNSKINFAAANYYHCYWCRHLVHGFAFGCPINYISSKMTISYQSHSNSSLYTIKESVTSAQLQYVGSVGTEEKKVSGEISLGNSSKGYYETDGIFCSFNCCFSFIKDNAQNSMYKISEHLIHKLLSEITGCDTNVIWPAPHWRMLKVYGGHLSIEEFRKSFNSVKYIEKEVKKNCSMTPVEILYTEKK